MTTPTLFKTEQVYLVPLSDGKAFIGLYLKEIEGWYLFREIVDLNYTAYLFVPSDKVSEEDIDEVEWVRNIMLESNPDYSPALENESFDAVLHQHDWVEIECTDSDAIYVGEVIDVDGAIQLQEIGVYGQEEAKSKIEISEVALIRTDSLYLDDLYGVHRFDLGIVDWEEAIQLNLTDFSKAVINTIYTFEIEGVEEEIQGIVKGQDEEWIYLHLIPQDFDADGYCLLRKSKVVCFHQDHDDFFTQKVMLHQKEDVFETKFPYQASDKDAFWTLKMQNSLVNLDTIREEAAYLGAMNFVNFEKVELLWLNPMGEWEEPLAQLYIDDIYSITFGTTYMNRLLLHADSPEEAIQKLRAKKEKKNDRRGGKQRNQKKRY